MPRSWCSLVRLAGLPKCISAQLHPSCTIGAKLGQKIEALELATPGVLDLGIGSFIDVQKGRTAAEGGRLGEWEMMHAPRREPHHLKIGRRQ